MLFDLSSLKQKSSISMVDGHFLIKSDDDTELEKCLAALDCTGYDSRDPMQATILDVSRRYLYSVRRNSGITRFSSTVSSSQIKSSLLV